MLAGTEGITRVGTEGVELVRTKGIELAGSQSCIDSEGFVNK